MAVHYNEGSKPDMRFFSYAWDLAGALICVVLLGGLMAACVCGCNSCCDYQAQRKRAECWTPGYEAGRSGDLVTICPYLYREGWKTETVLWLEGYATGQREAKEVGK